MPSVTLKTTRSTAAAMMAVAFGLSVSGPANAGQEAPAVATASAAALSTADAAHYRLGPDDKVHIITYDEQQLTGDFLVGGSGNISMPLIGDVRAAGKTVGEVADEISAALQQGYIKSPSVSVEVITFRPFYILGEVNKPGQYPYMNGMTVMSAVATAGGFTYRANQKTIFLRKAGSPSENKERLTTATDVQPGDTIRISERFF